MSFMIKRPALNTQFCCKTRTWKILRCTFIQNVKAEKRSKLSYMKKRMYLLLCYVYYLWYVMWKRINKNRKKTSEYCIWLIFIAHNHWYSKKESKWGRLLLNLTKSNVERMDMSFSVTQPDYSSLWDRSVIIKKINDREHFFHGKRIVHKYLINDIVRMHVFLEKGLYGISRRIFMCFNFYIYY